MTFIPVYLSATILIAAASEPYSFTIIDYWQGKCDKGDQAACAKLEHGKHAEKKLEKLNILAHAFRQSIEPIDFLLDEKPNLGKAYPIVIRGYLESFEDQQNATHDQYAIDYCARHFHNYWLNKKYWWPTNSEDKPDWETIYIYIVDHYHGICLQKSF